MQHLNPEKYRARAFCFSNASENENTKIAANKYTRLFFTENEKYNLISLEHEVHPNGGIFSLLSGFHNDRARADATMTELITSLARYKRVEH